MLVIFRSGRPSRHSGSYIQVYVRVFSFLPPIPKVCGDILWMREEAGLRRGREGKEGMGRWRKGDMEVLRRGRWLQARQGREIGEEYWSGRRIYGEGGGETGMGGSEGDIGGGGRASL